MASLQRESWHHSCLALSNVYEIYHIAISKRNVFIKFLLSLISILVARGVFGILESLELSLIINNILGSC